MILITPPVHIAIPNVPFYSQFKDIEPLSWRKIGCGVTSLAMVINYYIPESVTVNKLLTQGIASGAYNKQNGWIHKGLIELSKKYGLSGRSYDYSSLSNAAAYAKFKKSLENGPVIVSVHYKFDPKSSIPHLVVIDGIDGTTLYYNDPASSGKKEISVTNFQRGWKKKFIVIRPVTNNTLV